MEPRKQKAQSGNRSVYLVNRIARDRPDVLERTWQSVDEAMTKAPLGGRPRGQEQQEKREIPGYRPRRRVVEVCHSWLNRFRKLLVRFEKRLETHLALLQFACAYIVLKRAEVFR